MNQNNQYVQEDEIDLKELFKTLIENKMTIIVITLFITLSSVVYVLVKNPTPIYQGKVLVEIGEIQGKDFGTQAIDNPNNLALILKTEFPVEASSPRGTNNIIEITYQNENKQNIKDILTQSVSYTLQRSRKKTQNFENVLASKQIGKITIDDEQINKPKKKLIVTVAFVTGFIFSIFFVFFREFVRNFNSEEK